MKTRAWDGERFRDDYVVMPGGSVWSTFNRNHVDAYADDINEIVEHVDWKLSRFTGLCDKNGKEIYEGDVLHKNQFVRWARGEGEVYEKLMVVVEWGVSGFVLKRIGKSSKYILDMTKYEIIGNIFQNPELLEEVK